MRLVKVVRSIDSNGIEVTFRANSVRGVLWLALPDGWDAFERDAKIAHVRQQVNLHLETHVYHDASMSIFPDLLAIDEAKDGFDELPGWATWSPAEAEAWVEANVTDLASVKTVLGKLAAAVLYLRDIAIEK